MYPGGTYGWAYPGDTYDWVYPFDTTTGEVVNTLITVGEGGGQQ
jgi:hypothetical protein